MENKKELRAELFSWLFTISITIFLVWIMVNFIFGITVVKGSSMEPTLKTYDRLFVNKIGLVLDDLKYGDIVTFHNPNDNKEHYIKRIIAVEGDVVEIIDSKVYVNGEKLKENYTKSKGDTEIANGSYWEIGNNEVFVLGDNRHISYDSRFFGPIDIDSIIGIAKYRIYPFDKVGEFASI